MIYIDTTQFFEPDSIKPYVGYDDEVYYDVSLVSKMTGEIVSISFDSKGFDELLSQMELNLISKMGQFIDYYDTRKSIERSINE